MTVRVGPGSTVLVTGGASGIGLGIVRAFVEKGAHVHAADLDESALSAATAEFGGSVTTHELDVRDRDAWASLADRIDNEGGLHVLVNNAGVGFLGGALDSSFSQWDWLIDINLTGVFNGIRTMAPRMLASGRPGHIVSTSSIGGVLGARGALYAAAKSGTVGLMESLRAELLGTDIGTSILLPGRVRTNIGSGLQPPGGDMTSGPVNPRAGVDALMDPRHVGRLVVEGVEGDQFYIFTHAEHGPLLERRFEAMRRSIPVDDIPPSRAEAELAIFDLPIYEVDR